MEKELPAGETSSCKADDENQPQDKHSDSRQFTTTSHDPELTGDAATSPQEPLNETSGRGQRQTASPGAHIDMLQGNPSPGCTDESPTGDIHNFSNDNEPRIIPLGGLENLEPTDSSDTSAAAHLSVETTHIMDPPLETTEEFVPQVIQDDSKAGTLSSNESPPIIDVPVSIQGASILDDDNLRDLSNDDDDTESTEAAMAMAALAVAASANNPSPSAAAEAARALAPNLVPGAISPRNEEITCVRIKDVKAHMLKKTRMTTRSKSDSDSHSDDGWDGRRNQILNRLANGENDSFLQNLLLLQYFAVLGESQGKDGASEGIENESILHNRAAVSSEKVRSLLHMAEDAYDALESLLPPVPENEEIDHNDGDSEYYGIDTPPVVPDLLPPCTSSQGDCTLQFFRACQGVEHDGDGQNDPTCSLSTEDEAAVDKKASDADEADATESSAHKTAASVFSSMFSSMTIRSSQSAKHNNAFAGVFRKRPSRTTELSDTQEVLNNVDSDLRDGEYAVSIDREMLGLTVENVLERTVVRTVMPGGAAKKAGAKVGSLIVKVGSVETRNLTHFETIDELRQSQRPLKLVLRLISSDSLRAAREEMGRLIRGGGFGTSLPVESSSGGLDGQNTFKRTHHGKPTNVEAFSQVLHHRWTKNELAYVNRKQEALLHAGEKLVWILTLLIIGLERETAKAPLGTSRESSAELSPGRRNHTSHMAEDYLEASRSISKVLLDFVSAKLQFVSSKELRGQISTTLDPPQQNDPNLSLKYAPPAHSASGRIDERARVQNAMNANTTMLLRIGDVLHRTRTFLADPASPPAALLRGEVISFLCDILDIDTEMELSDEEAGSSTAGGRAAPINDLGSAGSLLKLIILNCSMMRSPGCTSLTNLNSTSDADLMKEQRRRFGGSKKHENNLDLHRFHAGNRFLAVVHRLAASRSISARVAACSLAPVLWGHLDFPHQLQLRGVITRALHDVDITVRKSTAGVLHEIAELVFDPRAVPWLVLMCERAMTDPEPQLRAAAMTLTWHLAEHLPNAFLGDASQGSRSLRRLPPRIDPTFAQVYLLQCKLLPVATRLAEDRAPTVRLAVAAQCDRLCNAIGDHWNSVVIDLLQALLGDTDENVRSEAVLCVPRLAETVLVCTSPDGVGGVSVLDALLPVSVKLLNDPSPNVRISLATSAGELLTLLVGLETLHEIMPPSPTHDQFSNLNDPTRSNKKHVDETLIPLLQNLLHDPEPEVTSSALRAVSNASRGNVREIRVRQNSRILDDDMSLSSFQSHASSERKEPVFIPVLSEEQVMRLLPTLSDLAKNRQWRVRQGAVEIVPALLGCTKKLEIRSEVAQLCFRLMNDKVDAVRRTAAECLCLSGGGLGNHGDESAAEWIESIVIPHIRDCSMSSDSKQRILSLKMIDVIMTSGICPARRRVSKIDGSGLEKSSPHQVMSDVAFTLARDAVANVRLNFGRVACSIVPVIDEDEIGLWTKALCGQIEAEEQREGGGDRDVLFFAAKAMLRVRDREKDDMSLPSVLDGSNR